MISEDILLQPINPQYNPFNEEKQIKKVEGELIYKYLNSYSEKLHFNRKEIQLPTQKTKPKQLPKRLSNKELAQKFMKFLNKNK